MQKKEEFSYGVIGLFILVSIALILLMSPYEPITSNAVADVTAYVTAAEFVGQNIVLLVVVFFVLGLAIGGIIFLIKQHNIRQRILAGIPHEKLETIREYAKSTMAKGFTKEQVKKALIDTGWQESQADALLHEF